MPSTAAANGLEYIGICPTTYHKKKETGIGKSLRDLGGEKKRPSAVSLHAIQAALASRFWHQIN